MSDQDAFELKRKRRRMGLLSEQQDIFEEKDVPRPTSLDSGAQATSQEIASALERDNAIHRREADSECLQSMARSLRSLRLIGLYFLWLSIAGLILGLFAFMSSH